MSTSHILLICTERWLSFRYSTQLLLWFYGIQKRGMRRSSIAFVPSESDTSLLVFFKKIWFVYFWPHWVFTAVHGLNRCGEPRLLPRCGARASHCGGISGCRAWTLEDAGSSSCGSQALAWDQELWRMGLAAQQHIRSSQTSNQTCVPCICRQILFFFFFNLI